MHRHTKYTLKFCIDTKYTHIQKNIDKHTLKHAKARKFVLNMSKQDSRIYCMHV